MDEADTVVTTTSITAVSVSTRSAHDTSRSPEVIQRMSGTLIAEAACRARRPDMAKPTDRTRPTTGPPETISSAGGDQLDGAVAEHAAEQPRDQAPSSGRKTIAE